MLRIAVVAAAAVAALVSASVAAGACDRGMLSKYTLASGHLAGTKWSLRAIDSGDRR